MAEQRMPFSLEIENDPLHLAAADWFVRLQSTEVSLEETLAWQAWIHENPANAEAFARIEEISHALCDVPGARGGAGGPAGARSLRRFGSHRRLEASTSPALALGRAGCRRFVRPHRARLCLLENARRKRRRSKPRLARIAA